jgi:hypothetical protein
VDNEKAREVCQKWGGKLTVIDGLAKQKTIETMIDNSESFWIGMDNTQLTGLSRDWLKSADLVDKVPLKDVCMEFNYISGMSWINNCDCTGS